MRKINNFQLCATLFFLCFLVGCEPDKPEHEIRPNPITEMMGILKETGRYDIAGHTCTVELSSDGFKYPYTPYSNEWFDHKNDTDLVPMDIIDTMSTLGLMETILDHPYLLNLLSIPDSFPKFFDHHFSRQAPGLLEKLYARDDAASVLINRYLEMHPTCYENNYSTAIGYRYDSYTLAFLEIQVLLAQYPILNMATEEELVSLSIHAVKVYLGVMETRGNTFMDSYIINGGIYLAMRIMLEQGYQPFKSLYKTYKTYIITGGRLTPEAYSEFMLTFNNFIGEHYK